MKVGSVLIHANCFKSRISCSRTCIAEKLLFPCIDKTGEGSDTVKQMRVYSYYLQLRRGGGGGFTSWTTGLCSQGNIVAEAVVYVSTGTK